MAAEADKEDQTTRRQRALIEAYNELFRSENGKLVLADLEQFCALLSDGFDPDSGLRMAYNEGRRSVGAYILHMLEMSRTEFMETHQQAQAIMERE